MWPQKRLIVIIRCRSSTGRICVYRGRSYFCRYLYAEVFGGVQYCIVGFVLQWSLVLLNGGGFLWSLPLAVHLSILYSVLRVFCEPRWTLIGGTAYTAFSACLDRAVDSGENSVKTLYLDDVYRRHSLRDGRAPGGLVSQSGDNSNGSSLSEAPHSVGIRSRRLSRCLRWGAIGRQCDDWRIKKNLVHL